MRKQNEKAAGLEAEVRHWLNRLLLSTGDHRQQAAAELNRLGIWARGSVRTRGDLGRPAPNRLPEPQKLEEVVACLKDADQEVRRQVALALGEWGDERAAEALCQLLQTETDDGVRLYYIAGLRLLGGPTAAEGLRRAVEGGSEAVRDAALAAIEELATGGRQEDTEGPDVGRASASLLAGGTPAVRARGGTGKRATTEARRGETAGRIAGTLQRLRRDETASAYLRQRATEVLGYLGPGGPHRG